MQAIEQLRARQSEILTILKDEPISIRQALSLLGELAEIQTALDSLDGSLDDFADGRRLLMAGAL